MTHRSEIDRQLAEIEALARGEPAVTVSTDDDPNPKKKSPNWFAILAVAVAIDLAARFFIPASDSFVRLLEAAILGGGAALLAVPVIRKPRLTGTRGKIHTWLAALLGLGAVRSALWGLAVPVELANLTVFVAGLIGIAAYVVIKRRGSTDDGPSAA